MTEELFHDNLRLILIQSSSPMQDSRKCYNFDVDFSFRHQLFEKEDNDADIQSSEIVGSISNYQSPQLNKTPSQVSSSNDLKSSRNLVSKCSTLKCQFSSPALKCSSTLNLPLVTPSSTSKTMPYSTPISSISERTIRASELFDAKLKEFEIQFNNMLPR